MLHIVSFHIQVYKYVLYLKNGVNLISEHTSMT